MPARQRTIGEADIAASRVQSKLTAFHAEDRVLRRDARISQHDLGARRVADAITVEPECHLDAAMQAGRHFEHRVPHAVMRRRTAVGRGA